VGVWGYGSVGVWGCEIGECRMSLLAWMIRMHLPDNKNTGFRLPHPYFHTPRPPHSHTPTLPYLPRSSFFTNFCTLEWKLLDCCILAC